MLYTTHLATLCVFHQVADNQLFCGLISLPRGAVSTARQLGRDAPVHNRHGAYVVPGNTSSLF